MRDLITNSDAEAITQRRQTQNLKKDKEEQERQVVIAQQPSEKHRQVKLTKAEVQEGKSKSESKSNLPDSTPTTAIEPLQTESFVLGVEKKQACQTEGPSIFSASKKIENSKKAQIDKYNTYKEIAKIVYDKIKKMVNDLKQEHLEQLEKTMERAKAEQLVNTYEVKICQRPDGGIVFWGIIPPDFADQYRQRMQVVRERLRAKGIILTPCDRTVLRDAKVFQTIDDIQPPKFITNLREFEPIGQTNMDSKSNEPQNNPVPGFS